MKTVGVAGLLRESVENCRDVESAFIFGSVARAEETAGSDVDLMILGSIGLRKLSGILAGVSEKIGREINPHVMTVEEFIKRKREGEHFVSELVVSPKILIKGHADDLEKLG
jgi:predicted nucleotidyltransferase